MELTSYLNFNGQCEAAFKFYEKALGGKIEAMIAHEGTPAADHVPADWRKKILHARLVVGDQALMASDVPPDHYKKPQGFSVSIDVKTPAEAERVFRALEEGGAVTMQLQQTFWAARFGTPWMINCGQAA